MEDNYNQKTLYAIGIGTLMLFSTMQLNSYHSNSYKENYTKYQPIVQTQQQATIPSKLELIIEQTKEKL